MVRVQAGDPGPELTQGLGHLAGDLAGLAEGGTGAGLAAGIGQRGYRLDRLRGTAEGKVVQAAPVDALLEEAAHRFLPEPVQRRQVGRLPHEHHGGRGPPHRENAFEFAERPEGNHRPSAAARSSFSSPGSSISPRATRLRSAVVSTAVRASSDRERSRSGGSAGRKGVSSSALMLAISSSVRHASSTLPSAMSRPSICSLSTVFPYPKMECQAWEAPLASPWPTSLATCTASCPVQDSAWPISWRFW